MADNRSNRGRRDRARINTHEDYELRYWSKRFGITKKDLASAVKRAGSNSIKAVEKELRMVE